MTFLYADGVRVQKDDFSILFTTEGVRPLRTRIPSAALSCLMLGPGTSITSPALRRLAEDGCTVTTTGEGGVGFYSAVVPESLTTRWLYRQVECWSNPDERLAVAVRMYQSRFGEEDLGDKVTVARLRGMEGQRVKKLYQILAKQHNVRFRRNYDWSGTTEPDAVNLALSAANHALYGVVHSAICALGLTPALGFVHTSSQRAFVYDIADQFKAISTIPVAFAAATQPDPERAVRRALRDDWRALRLLPRIVDEIALVLAIETEKNSTSRARVIELWDPSGGDVSGGINWGDLAESKAKSG